MKRIMLLVLALLTLFPTVVIAQEATVVQFYLIPVDTSVENYRGPLYLKWRWNPGGLDVLWSCKDYGSIDILVCAVDAEPSEHTWLASQVGVYQFPVNLDVTPSPAELSALETALEATYIPADWLSPSETWRDALRTVTSLFLYMQRLTVLAGNPLEWGVTLNTTFRNLDPVYQDAMTQAADDLGYDSSVIRDNWTLRVILKNMADAWGDAPILFGNVTTL